MNEEEEHEYRRWSAEPDARNEQPVSNELNDIPFVVKYEESLGPILLLWLVGGLVFLVIIIPGGSENAGLFVGSLLLHLFLFFFLGYYLIGKPVNEYKEKTKLATEANRKRKNENTRKRNLKQKNNDLEKAKSLVDEGGIDNLKKAIGIFEKYAKY